MIISLVLGGLALLLSWVPIINNFAFIIAIPALILAIIGLISNRKNKKTLSVIALSIAIAIASMVIVLVTQYMISSALDNAGQEFEKAIDKIEKEIENKQKEADENFKWTKADYDPLVVGDILSGAGGTNYDEIIAKFGEPSDVSDSTFGDVESRHASYNNFGASEYQSVILTFTKQSDGTWLLSDKMANGLK